VTDADTEYRLYQELAPWWPLISPPAEYAQDAAAIAAVFESAAIPVRTVLDLGSGGGHVALHLKDGLTLTLVDRSEPMLEMSRKVNPDCRHVQGDMRTVRLGELFDGVLVHDAIDYLIAQRDLRMVIDTAFAHCRRGGMAVFAPDHTAETFRAGAGAGGGGEDGGRQASFRERTSDPDPADEWILAEYEFTLREADGRVQVVRESHRLGSFRRETWLRLLADAGFSAEIAAGTFAGNDVRLPRVLFIGHKPG
jgi:SAM-dependent methyltransferase